MPNKMQMQRRGRIAKDAAAAEEAAATAAAEPRSRGSEAYESVCASAV